MFNKLLFGRRFHQRLYLEEMATMLDKAIIRIQAEKPDFKIYTASIWTDANAAASSINFDSKENSLRNVRASNESSKPYYDRYIAEGDLARAELFQPNEGSRVCNPADFELRDFEEIKNKSFPNDWESQTAGKCWKLLEPALIKIGEQYFHKLKTLNVDEGFELSINSQRDWYDKTWH
jgi:hypothetical protein